MKEKKTLTLGQMKQRKRKLQNLLRRVVQLAFFIFAPSLFSEAFAGAKNSFQAVGKGQVLELSKFSVTFLLLAGLTILIGRFFCGFACAFGTFGDFLYEIASWLQKKFKKRLPKIPEKHVIWLQKVKYINLIVLLCACFLGGGSWINNNSPWSVFSRIRALQFLGLSTIGIVVLVCIAVGMVLEERFFCQFFCPLGALFSLLPILPIGTKKRDAQNCIKGCNACRKQCPVHIKPEGISERSNECIQCGRCRLICPKGNIRQLPKWTRN